MICMHVFDDWIWLLSRMRIMKEIKSTCVSFKCNFCDMWTEMLCQFVDCSCTRACLNGKDKRVNKNVEQKFVRKNGLASWKESPRDFRDRWGLLVGWNGKVKTFSKREIYYYYYDFLKRYDDTIWYL